MNDKDCEHCGTSNEGNRVYCKDCGSRLPEQPLSDAPANLGSELQSPGLTAPPIPPATYRPNVRRNLKAQAPVKQRSFFGQLLKLAVLGFLLACVIQAARRPGDLPHESQGNRHSSDVLYRSMDTCAHSSARRAFSISSSALDQFMESYAKQAPMDRAFVTLNLGGFKFFVEKNLFGYGIIFSVQCSPVISNGEVLINQEKLSVGRLPLPISFKPIVEQIFQPTLARFTPAIELIRKTEAITINPNGVIFQWQGSGISTH